MHFTSFGFAGFKSVFTITDEPHILSGPYCFKFRHTNVSSGELGFVVPYQVDHTELPLASLSADEYQAATSGTLLYLPFRNAEAYDVHAKLMQQFCEEVRPEVLTLSCSPSLSLNIAGSLCFPRLASH